MVNKVWHTWLVEQSFESQLIFREYKTVKMKSDTVDWKEHIVEIFDRDLNKVEEWLKANLKPAWYAHLVCGDELIVVYKGKSFRITSEQSFDEIRRYGRSLGIIENQLPSTKLFELARKSGY